MKAKKAIKRLDKIEAILSDVIDQYAGNGIRELLDTARDSIINAKAGVNKKLESAGRKGVSANGEKGKESGAKTKPAAKKVKGVKRKGVHTETAERGTQQSESKTA